MTETNLKEIEKIIGYRFSNKKLLEQAFTRKETSERYNYNADNETLEFIGDRFLSLILVYLYSKNYGIISPHGHYRNEKSIGELNYRVLHLGTNEVLENCIYRTNLYKYLELNNCNKNHGKKAVADLFEAILGALAIDSEWSLNVGAGVVLTLLNETTYTDKSDELSRMFVDFRTDLCSALETLCSKIKESSPFWFIERSGLDLFHVKLIVEYKEYKRQFNDYGKDITESKKTASF